MLFRSLGLFPQQLVVSFIGYTSDTFLIQDYSYKTLTLQQGIHLQQVEVNAGNATSRMSTLSTKGVETMGKNELLKAACCNLAESFGTNASVDVVFTDAVSGAKKIQMLGLDGVYTQLTAEGIPYLRGIVSSYGLTFVPGPWMESIQIAKGAGTVTTGYDRPVSLKRKHFVFHRKATVCFLAFEKVFSFLEHYLL